MNKHFTKTLSVALAMVIATTCIGVSGYCSTENDTLVVSAQVATETLNAQVPGYDCEDSYEFVTSIASLSDTVFASDYSDVAETGDDAISSAVEENEAEQARIAAEKAAQEAAEKAAAEAAKKAEQEAAKKETTSNNNANTTPAVTYTSVKETVYATSVVNVRTGPGTDYAVVGALAKGESITRTGIGSDGWSKVSYNGVTAYVKSNYLTTTKPASTSNGNSNDNSSSNNDSTPGTVVETIPTHTHNYSSKVTSPTCTAQGYTTYTCSCGDSYKSNYKDATGHNYTTKTVAPTTGSEGYDIHTCNTCGASYKDNYKEKVTLSVSEEMATRSNMKGRLYMPSVGMTPVALFNSNSQTTCDNVDSACIFDYYDGSIVIADHVHQNFNVLKKVTVGTTATIDVGDTTYTLKCVQVNGAFECGTYGVFHDAFGLTNLKNYVIMYTCNGWPTVTATLWEVTSGGFSNLYADVIG